MPMVQGWVLERLFSEQPKHPDQAYRLKGADSVGRVTTVGPPDATMAS